MRVLVIPDIHLKVWIFDQQLYLLWTIRILSGVMAIMMSATRGEGLRPDILLMLRGRLCQSSTSLRTALRVRHISI